MKLQKRIAYCYPSSGNAKLLQSASGGYYVETRLMREDGSWSLWSPAFKGDGCFGSAVNSDLLSLFFECDGEAQPNGF